MNNQINTSAATNDSKKATGAILLVIGGILLINQLDLFFIPDWLFSWPMWIIAYGTYMGAKYNFKKPLWILIIMIGVAFLLVNNIEGASRIVWPFAIMGFGSWLVFKPQIQKDENYIDPKKETFEFDKNARAGL